MLRADRVTIYPISVHGAYPPESAIESAVERLRPSFQGDVIVEDPAHIEIEGADEGAISIPVVSSQQVKPGPGVITLVFVPEVKGDFRGIYIAFDDARQQITFDAKAISEMTMPFFNKRQAWEVVITHELGHVIGVPADAEHKWDKGHCTDPSCVMYPGVDPRSVIRAIVSLGPPMDLCGKCEAEITRAQHNPNQ